MIGGNFDNHDITAALRNLLNDPHRAGGLTANTPHYHDITYKHTMQILN